ncbi:hypothetical protein B835_2017 [Enterococcus mundtii 3F]|uniref:hypothetical protein n=1 Tax=Enterococcus mundtii TaxID=53346 RepID=UPI0023023F0C|nr:hypothetical protein [Enterococcus mundtii]MDA9462089.1 hypothetical protein [Enterococcus mundtii 3F]
MGLMSDKISVFSNCVHEVQYCIRELKSYKEEKREVDVKRFLNAHLSYGVDNQFPEMKKLWNSIPEEKQPEWYSLLQLHHEISQLEEFAQTPFG